MCNLEFRSKRILAAGKSIYEEVACQVASPGNEVFYELRSYVAFTGATKERQLAEREANLRFLETPLGDPPIRAYVYPQGLVSLCVGGS